MTTKELKEYISSTLGNNVKCLLSSYWWKRLFTLIVDNVESNNKKLTNSINKLSDKVSSLGDKINTYEKISHANLLKKALREELVPGKKYAITDYKCSVNINTDYATVASEYGSNFTIIATATSNYELNENVLIANSPSEGEINPDEGAYEAKYSIFNDVSRFNWAKIEDLEYDLMIEFDEPRYSWETQESIIWNNDCNKFVGGFSPENSDKYLTEYKYGNYLCDSDGNPLDKSFTFNVGDSVYYKRYDGVTSAKVIYTKELKRSGDAVLTHTNSYFYLMPYDFQIFIWNEDSKRYINRSNSNDVLQDNSGFIITEKRQSFTSSEIFRSTKNNKLYTVGIGVPGGRGVIYYMKDENGNEAYYDFKNIMFYFSDVDSKPRFTFHYTYNGDGVTNVDGSRWSRCKNVRIGNANGYLNRVGFDGRIENVTVDSSVRSRYFTGDLSNKKIGQASNYNIVTINEFDGGVVDNELNYYSTNPVQNKVIYQKISETSELMFFTISSGGSPIIVDTSSFSVMAGCSYVIDKESAGDIVITSFEYLRGVAEEYNNYTYIQKVTIMFKGATSITFPENVIWANGIQPDIDPSLNYELSIVRTKIADNITYKAVLTPFY